MSRHVDDIKSMLFEEPDFESDDEEEEKRKVTKKKRKEESKPKVETIVFCDPAKRKKLANKSLPTQTPPSPSDDFDLEKARFDVHKFGIKGFEKSKYEDARIALAVSLGAKPPKRKFRNYRELLEENRAKKIKDKEEEENARLLGDLFQKTPNKNSRTALRSRQKRVGQGEVGAMRFSSVGKFRGGMLKLSDKDISNVQRKSKKFSNKKR